MVESVVQSHVEIVVGSSEKSEIRVLHVDDELGLLEVAKQCLEMQGPFQVDTAGSAEEALSMLKEKEYDAVISDYQMPGKDGLEFLEELRKSGSSIPFILFTGKGREEVAIKALNLGASQYLNKAGDPETVYSELSHSITYAVERESAVRKLRESEERFRDLYEGIQEPVAIYVGREGRLINCNSAFKKLTGYTDEELKGKTFLDLTHPEDRAMVLEKYRTGYPEERLPLVYEVRGINKKGETDYLEVSVNAYRRKGRVIGIEAIHRVINERKKMEEKLRESEQKLRDLYESVPDTLSVYVGKEGHLIEYNKAFKKWSGFTDEELKDKAFPDLVHPDDRALVMEKYKTNYSEDQFPLIYEIRTVNKKGESHPTEISVGPYRKKGRIIGINVMHRDITERKRMEEELRNSEKRLDAMNEKLRVVGSLTRHDVRNKLSAVTGNAYLLRRKLAGNPEALEHLTDMENAVRNVEAIFEFARAYEKLGVEQLTYMDVKKTVEEAVGLFPDLKGVKIVNDCGGLTLLADSLLRQLFYNLIDDSLKYGEKLTQIRIRHEKSEDKLKLIYEDDGVGISQDAKPKLFSEGYTTGKGSGYGLYLIKRMTEVYVWAIQETGTPDNGVCFTILIPEKNQDCRENYQLH